MKRTIRALNQLKAAHAGYKQFSEEDRLIQDEITTQEKELHSLKQKRIYSENKRKGIKNTRSSFISTPAPELDADLVRADAELTEVVECIKTIKSKLSELNNQQHRRCVIDFREVFYKYKDALYDYRLAIARADEKEIKISREDKNNLIKAFSGEGMDAQLNWHSIFGGEFPMPDNDELRTVFIEIRTKYFDQVSAA